MNKILVVDGNQIDQSSLNSQLSAHGYAVLLAGNGYEAVTAVQIEQPSLILMNMNLPKLDGWMAIEQLKASVYTKEIPIIALIEPNESNDAQRSLTVGCDGYVAKPIEPAKLLSQITLVLHPD
ncbi:MAG: response regulator [Chloroflexi bacterium]|nr:response regulator [Chloroflexota bacterium]